MSRAFLFYPLILDAMNNVPTNFCPLINTNLTRILDAINHVPTNFCSTADIFNSESQCLGVSVTRSLGVSKKKSATFNAAPLLIVL